MTRRSLRSEFFDLCALIAQWKRAHFEYFPLDVGEVHNRDCDQAIKAVLGSFEARYNTLRAQCFQAGISPEEIGKIEAFWKGKLAE